MYKYCIVLILFLSAFLRFYNLPETFVFAGDEEHQAILAQSIIKDFHIIWMGVNAAHLGFYLGPYWTYFTAFWLWLSQGDPLITGYVASSIGVLTTLLIIITGSTLFNKQVGLSAGLLYAVSPLIVFFDQKYWNPTLIPALSLLMLLSLYKLKNNPKWMILFFAGYGLVFHTHLSLVPLLFIAVFWIIKEKIKLSRQVFFLSLITFLLILAPLLAFDYFRKGTNITTPLRFAEISADPVNKVNPNHHFKALFETLGRIWFLAPFGSSSDEVITSCTTASRVGSPPQIDSISKRYNPPFWLSAIGFSIMLIFLLNKATWQYKNTTLLALFILSVSISFLLFPGGSYEYYLLGIFPLLLFLPGIAANYFPALKVFIYPTVFLSAILAVYSVMTNNPEFGLKAKNSLVRQTLDIIGNYSFDLKQTGLCHFYEGWRYLFVLNGRTPERSDSDKGLGWLYSEEITQKPTKYTVIMSESRVPVDFETKDSKIIDSGGFRAYIFVTP